MVGGEDVATFVSMFPPEVAAQLSFWLKAVGGLFTIYLIFLIVRLILQAKQTRDFTIIKKDLKLIKKKLKIKD
jgi:hypothetical protein